MFSQQKSHSAGKTSGERRGHSSKKGLVRRGLQELALFCSSCLLDLSDLDPVGIQPER